MKEIDGLFAAQKLNGGHLKDYTDITILLDRSGSMASIKTAMESGFDEFLAAHRLLPSTRLSLVQFDGTDPYETVYTALPIGDAPRLRLEPRGMTPLLDAFCRTIDATGARLAKMNEADRPERVLFVAITDGQENCSKEFKRKDVKDRVTQQAAKYNWQFVYLGANQDAIAEAESFGIAGASAITYTASLNDSQHKMRSLARTTVAYASTGNADDLKWLKSDREDMTHKGDLTIGPAKQ